MSEKAATARGNALFAKSCTMRQASASRGCPASSQRHKKETASFTFPRGGPLCTSGQKASLKSRNAAAASPASRAPHGHPCPATPAPPASDLEPFLADVGVGFDVGRGAFEHDAAVAPHVEPPRDAHRDGELLLYQHD